MYTNQQSPYVPAVGLGLGGGMGFEGFLLGALLSRNGGLFGGNTADATAVNAVTDARFDGLNSQMSNLSNQLQSNGMADAFSQLNQNLTSLQGGLQNQITQTQLYQTQQTNTLAAALAQCCCENRVATEQVKTSIALTQANLSKEICDRSHDTENLLNAQTAQLTALITSGQISDLQSQVQNARQDATVTQMQAGFNAILMALGQLNHGNGNGK
jgi:exonuclease VII large subunit